MNNNFNAVKLPKKNIIKGALIANDFTKQAATLNSNRTQSSLSRFSKKLDKKLTPSIESEVDSLNDSNVSSFVLQKAALKNQQNYQKEKFIKKGSYSKTIESFIENDNQEIIKNTKKKNSFSRNKGNLLYSHITFYKIF